MIKKKRKEKKKKEKLIKRRKKNGTGFKDKNLKKGEIVL